MALNIDVAPTFLDYAGIWVPKVTDGHSLRPLLEGSKAKWRDQFFYEHHYHNRGSTAGAIPRCEGIRTTEWKYITYIDEGMPYEELFDLKHDPHETMNLAADPRYRDELARMREKYQAWLRALPPAVLPTPAPKKASQ
jgi:arylsulfatase A-like enzyme